MNATRSWDSFHAGDDRVEMIGMDPVGKAGRTDHGVESGQEDQ